MALERLLETDKNKVLLIGAVISVGLVSAFAYHSILGYFFTGTDTVTLIETSRIHSFKDFTRIFSEPLMAGSKFVDIAKFFRPVASLSYALDYSIWNLNPFGFQLTNLLLNASVACLVVGVMYLLCNGNILFAWLSGLIFALHPILVDSVPATDRRHDIIAAMFLLLSLFLFLKSKISGSNKKWLLCCSLFSYLLALGGKEIAIILPALIFAQIFIFSTYGKWVERSCLSLRQSTPYFLITAGYLIWRTSVLKGLGGYLKGVPLTWNDIQAYGANIFHNYFLDLTYPADLFGVFDTGLANLWTFLMLSVFGLYLVLFLWGLSSRRGPSYTQKSIKLLSFLVLWLLIPLILFVVTLTFAHRSMYISAIPFSALLAYPLAECIKHFRTVLTKFRINPSVGVKTCFCYKSEKLVLILGLSMLSFLLAYSPIIRPYDQWEASGCIGRMILTKLASGTRQVNQDCRVDLYNLPNCLRSYEKREPKAKDVTYLSDYSIKSWLNLCGFQKKMDVIIHSRSQPWDFSGDLSVAILKLGKQNLRAIVRIRPLAKRVSPVWTPLKIP